MTSQSSTPDWSGAVQRELDGLQRNVDTRFVDFSSRLDRLLVQTEHYTDMRFSTVNEKIDNADDDIESLKTDLRHSFESLRSDITVERNRYQFELAKEIEDRKKEHQDYLKSRQSQFRWLVSMVMIPITIAVIDLLFNSR